LHRYKTALATSSQSDRARGFLVQAGLWDSFDVIVCRDDIAVPKPAPDIYLKAAERLGVSPEDCLAAGGFAKRRALRVSRGHARRNDPGPGCSG
jgi:beta-phosphoglucomutase-like phosphatase (HAD superfamily)